MECLFSQFREDHHRSRESPEDIAALFELESRAYCTRPTCINRCPNCFSEDCFEESEYISCRICGHVIGRPFDNTAEYRYFANEDRGSDPTRVGAPQDSRLPNASLGTVILNSYKTNKNMYRVCKYHIWNTIPYNERSLIQMYERLSLAGLNYGVNQSVIDAAKNIYIMLSDGTRHGIGRDAILSACMYIALKNSGSPRKPKEVAVIFGVAPTVFTKALKQIQETISLARQKGKLQSESILNKNTSSTSASAYIQLPLSRMSITRSQMEYIGKMALLIADAAEKHCISQENMPPSLAAGCIAFVIKRCADIDISIIKIAAASEISLATIQKCLRRLEMHTSILEKYIRPTDILKGY